MLCWPDSACSYRKDLSDAGQLTRKRRQHSGPPARTAQDDFAAFRASGGAAKTSTRTLFDCCVTADGGSVRLAVSADGFLYNMVRIIAGTLVEVGSGRRTLADVERALREPRRVNAGRTLPPHGLCLESVQYS